MSVISTLPNYIQVMTPFQQQPYGFFGANQFYNDPTIINAVLAGSNASKVALVPNPDYVRPTGVLVAVPGVGQAIAANAQTITVVENGKIVLTTALGAGVTGLIIQKGATDGQELTLMNNSAQSMTFATAGTSNVQGGTGTSIAAGAAKKLMWDAGTALWWPS